MIFFTFLFMYLHVFCGVCTFTLGSTLFVSPSSNETVFALSFFSLCVCLSTTLNLLASEIFLFLGFWKPNISRIRTQKTALFNKTIQIRIPVLLQNRDSDVIDIEANTSAALTLWFFSSCQSALCIVVPERCGIVTSAVYSNESNTPGTQQPRLC